MTGQHLTYHMLYISASFFLILEASSFNCSPDLTLHPSGSKTQVRAKNTSTFAMLERRLARARYRTKNRMRCSEVRDSPSCKLYAKETRIVPIITSRGGKAPESHRRSHFQSLPLWFCMLIRWRKEAIRLVTKPRNTQARRQCQSRQAKQFSRWLQCDMKELTVDLSSGKDKIRCQRPGACKLGIRRRIAFFRFKQEFTSHRTTSVRFRKLL